MLVPAPLSSCSRPSANPPPPSAIAAAAPPAETSRRRRVNALPLTPSSGHLGGNARERLGECVDLLCECTAVGRGQLVVPREAERRRALVPVEALLHDGESSRDRARKPTLSTLDERRTQELEGDARAV